MGKCNITLSFECNRSWEDLTRTEGEHRFCDGCQQNVYWVSSDQEVVDQPWLGHCIAFNAHQYPQQELDPPLLMGVVLPPPSKRKFYLGVLIAVLLVLCISCVLSTLIFVGLWHYFVGF